jgi:CRISPR-associated protein Csm3
MSQIIKLTGRVFITSDIEAVTGMHIGGTEAGIEIGGVDKTVIRDKLTNRPYIPGSSLRGKMRSLLEKYGGLKQNQRIGQGSIHSCQDRDEYATCDVCQVFGVPGERDFGSPTRLIVRDTHMTEASAKAIVETARTDLPYTEVKTEVSIDRVTSAANPRQMERVLAGTVFGPAEMVYSVYSGAGCNPGEDVARLLTVVEGLQLLEDDYLGGLGSRGSGKVRFQNIKVTVRNQNGYLQAHTEIGAYTILSDLVTDLPALQGRVRQQLGLS